MEILINIGIYLAIIGAIIGVVIGGLYLKRKFNLKEADIELVQLVLNVIDTVFSKGNIKYKGEVSVIVGYVIEALVFIEEFEEVDSLHQQKELVTDKAKQICEENGIKPDPDLLQLIDQIVDYFI